DASDSGPKTFTSLRDSTAGVDAGCSVFVQVCSPPLPLPAGDWGGIKLLGSGANATIDHANIRYATAAITMANGAMSTPPAGAPTAISTPAADGSRFGLVVSNSVIGPTFADGIVAVDTPIALVDNAFTGSGTGSVTYSAIYLNGLTAGDFNSPPSTPADPAVISGNTGSGNGLDAIVFHGTTAGTPTNPRPLNWQTVGASGLLGYV